MNKEAIEIDKRLRENGFTIKCLKPFHNSYCLKFLPTFKLCGWYELSELVEILESGDDFRGIIFERMGFKNE